MELSVISAPSFLVTQNDFAKLSEVPKIASQAQAKLVRPMTFINLEVHEAKLTHLSMRFAVGEALGNLLRDRRQ